MGNRVKGKVAVVTGAGSIAAGMGNGKASAILYAREGARVMLVDRNIMQIFSRLWSIFRRLGQKKC